MKTFVAIALLSVASLAYAAPRSALKVDTVFGGSGIRAPGAGVTGISSSAPAGPPRFSGEYSGVGLSSGVGSIAPGSGSGRLPTLGSTGGSGAGFTGSIDGVPGGPSGSLPFRGSSGSFGANFGWAAQPGSAGSFGVFPSRGSYGWSRGTGGYGFFGGPTYGSIYYGNGPFGSYYGSGYGNDGYYGAGFAPFFGYGNGYGSGAGYDNGYGYGSGYGFGYGSGFGSGFGGYGGNFGGNFGGFGGPYGFYHFPGHGGVNGQSSYRFSLGPAGRNHGSGTSGALSESGAASSGSASLPSGSSSQ